MAVSGLDKYASVLLPVAVIYLIMIYNSIQVYRIVGLEL